MRWLTLVRRSSLALIAVVAACGGGESDEGTPPSVSLFADPAVCDVPCDVVIDSGIVDGSGMTFTWDVGQGPAVGEERLAHRFETAGSYEVSLTVSAGAKSSTETVTVVAEVRPKAHADIDAAGGSVSQGGASVTVPAGVAPETVAVELTELPSMQDGAERVLGKGVISALGSAFQLSLPLKADTAIDVAVEHSAASGKGDKQLAWLVRMVGRPVLPADIEPVSSRAPLVDYALVPVGSVAGDVAHGSVFGRQRFQLVELTSAIDFQSLDVTEAMSASWQPPERSHAAAAGPAPAPSVVVAFVAPPTKLSQSAYLDAVKVGIAQSRTVLVGQKGFVAPKGMLFVMVGPLADPEWLGVVMSDDNQTIRLNPALTTTDQVKKVVAHEFFHLIQNLNSNQTSLLGYNDRDAWFSEGTADWACDEVFDTIPGHYHATPWRRFEKRLNQEGYKDNLEYETVGFWKWAEAHQPGIIRQIVEHRYLLTHTTPAGAATMVENTALADYLKSLKAMWSDVDFLSYVYDARYEKDFDTNETNANELWAPSPYLGPAKKVYADQSKDETVAAEVYGNSETNPAKIGFSLLEHLTAETMLVRSLDLSGDLNVRFPLTTGPLDAYVLVLEAGTGDTTGEQIVRDLSKSHPDVKLAFDPDKEAVVFIADGRWENATTDTPVTGEVQFWVEDPCGALPSTVINVTPADDLFVALTTAPSGSVVKLAPGLYTPPIKKWPTPEYGPFGGNVLVKDLILAGSGEGNTTIQMNGDPYAGLGLKTYGNATVRDLTIDARQSEPSIDALDAKHVTLCHVTITAAAGVDYGLVWGPWNGGSTSLRMFDVTLQSPIDEDNSTGVFLQSCYQTPADVSVEIKNSHITGWGEGVSYYTGEGYCGSISVSTDCKGFANNGYNVVHWTCGSGKCTAAEECK